MRFRFRSRFYPILDPLGRGDRTHLALAQAALGAGARLVQLRGKNLSTRELIEVARSLRPVVHAAGAQWIINDRVDVARLVDADGVHLGVTDLPVADARRILGPEAIIGLSTHSPEQVAEAQPLPIDYIGYGPVFATASKENPDPVQGIDALRQACATSALPVVAIGGIRQDNLAEVLAAGAAAVAVIGAFALAADPARASAEMLAQCDG